MSEVGKAPLFLFAQHDPNDCQHDPRESEASRAGEGYGKRTFTTDEAARQIARNGYRFFDRDGDQRIDVSYKLSGFTEQQKDCARRALRSWQDVANISFKENTQRPDGSIDITGSDRMASGVASGPARNNPAAWAKIGTQHESGAPKLGSYFTNLMLHEIGHTLGLAHPGEYNGGGSYNRDAVYAQDTRARSVMSYWAETNQPGHSFKNHYPSAPMMDDIAAIQKIYGANTQTRNTDTTYGFNSNADSDCMSLKSARDSAVFCVWDGGGNDTLDFSGFDQNQTINLNAESFSDVGGLKGNVSIAKGVVLENAVGGKGNDALIGNDAANEFTGGGGADRLTGGKGADTFGYEHASDSTVANPDLITDFTTGEDKIDLSRLLDKHGIKALNFTSALTGKAGDAVLSFDPRTGSSSLAIDLKGTGAADFLVKSNGEIKASDIQGGGDRKDLLPTPAPAPQPAPAPPPLPVPQPSPNPERSDTVYGFNSNSGNSAMTLTAGSDAPRFTVEDTAGRDTLDFSGFSQNQIINLGAGSRSSVGGLTDNVSISENSTIENAIGGSGNDRISGNLADNVLVAGTGADRLTGGGGANTFKYHSVADSKRYGADVLTDFTSGKDKIDLSPMIKSANLTLNLVDKYTGKAGDTIVKYNSQTGRYFVGIDLSGNGKTDFLIKSLRPITAQDVIGLNPSDGIKV